MNGSATPGRWGIPLVVGDRVFGAFALLVLFSFLYIPVWYYLCVAEERDLLIRYGTAYEEYRQRVGFWLPKRHLSYKGNGVKF